MKRLETIWRENSTLQLTEKFMSVVDILRNSKSFIFCLNNNEKSYFNGLIEEIIGKVKDLKLKEELDKRLKEHYENQNNKIQQHNQAYLNDISDSNSLDNEKDSLFSFFDNNGQNKQKEETKKFLEDDEIWFFNDPLHTSNERFSEDVEMEDVSDDSKSKSLDNIKNEEHSVPLDSIDEPLNLEDSLHPEQNTLSDSSSKEEMKNDNSLESQDKDDMAYFERLLSERNDWDTFRLAQNPMMTQEERICFYKSNMSQNEYSQIENPIIFYGDSDEDDIKFLSQSQMSESCSEPSKKIKQECPSSINIQQINNTKEFTPTKEVIMIKVETQAPVTTVKIENSNKLESPTKINKQSNLYTSWKEDILKPIVIVKKQNDQSSLLNNTDINSEGTDSFTYDQEISEQIENQLYNNKTKPIKKWFDYKKDIIEFDYGKGISSYDIELNLKLNKMQESTEKMESSYFESLLKTSKSKLSYPESKVSINLQTMLETSSESLKKM